MKAIGGLSRRSREQLARVLRDSKEAISVEQAAKSLGLSSNEAARKLSRWAQQGWVSRVRRGLYIPVPLESRTPNIALEDPWIIAAKLFAPCYIGGWTAAEYWDLTEQIYRSVAVMTATRPRDRNPSIKGSSFLLRTIPQRALFWTKPVWRGSVKVNVSDPSRTMLDMLQDPSIGGGLRPTVDIFRAYLQSSSKNIQLLVSYSERLENGAVFKRLGFLLDRFAPTETSAIDTCRSRLSKGKAKLDPSLPAERLSTKWQLWIPENLKKGTGND
jgi:predicted transcriptional regulator of viral defense system